LGLFFKGEIISIFCFKKIKVLVENLSGERIKALRSDKGDKFKSKEFMNFCEEKGVSVGFWSN
jgi:hypothetical protein